MSVVRVWGDPGEVLDGGEDLIRMKLITFPREASPVANLEKLSSQETLKMQAFLVDFL